MAHVVCLLVQLCCAAAAFPFPHSSFRTPTTSRRELESSASGPDEPVREVVRVLQLDPQSGLFRRGLTPRGAPSLRSRLSFPAFLSQGRVGPAFRAPLNPLNHLQPNPPAEMEAKKRKGLQMWQRALGKADKTTLSLPVNLKDTKQTCTAVPFTQRVTAAGCDAVTLNNKLCFGQCSSLFVPSEGEFAAVGGSHQRAPCSRCAPSRAHTVLVSLTCGDEVREKRVMVVEECKCETGREEKRAEAADYSAHA